MVAENGLARAHPKRQPVPGQVGGLSHPTGGPPGLGRNGGGLEQALRWLDEDATRACRGLENA